MTTAIQTWNTTFPVGSLDVYIQRAQQLPLLSAEEERTLAIRFREQNDLDAARKLVLSHIRHVIKIARGYAGYGLPQADLIQEGTIGLMKAVKRFDPNVGVKLISFAVHWIKAEIHEFILKNWRIVKVATTKAQRKLFFNLRKTKQKLNWLNASETKQLATNLRVKESTVSEMETRLYAHDAAFDPMVFDTSDEGSHLAPAEYLPNEKDNPALLCESENSEEFQHAVLEKSFLQLDARSQDIIKKRWLTTKKATLHDLAAEYQLSAERIRQLEKLAFDKLKILLSQA